MCGRYYIAEDDHDEMLPILKAMEKHYSGEYKTGEIFPGDAAPALVARGGSVVPLPASFGFPGFGSGKRLLINARAETAAEKPSFKDSLKNRRIILPASGFFEWSHDRDKTKYYFEFGENRLSYLCGLYRMVEGKCCFVILTGEANASMKGIHDRMPVIVGKEQVKSYLTDEAEAMSMIKDASPMLRMQPAENAS